MSGAWFDYGNIKPASHNRTVRVKNTKQTKILLQKALGLDTRERTVLLEEINDSTIRSQVETLLADENKLAVFLTNHSNEAIPDTTSGIAPGTLINRIRIIKELGQGGMGSVYLGFDEKLERQVAVKAIRPEHLKNPATQQRFIREAQILSKINHPSICQLYDYIETDQGDFLVLEYIRGKPLYQVPLNTTQKLKLLADLAAALAVAHEHGIVHRDLKPDNIMITEQGELKVLDFGIAQSLSQPRSRQQNPSDQATNDPLTQHGSLVGTIRYMSPEQARGERIDTASDLYALGIIAQEVFSHQAAYQVMETEQLLTDVQQGKRQNSDDLAVEWRHIIDQLTQLKPADRPDAPTAEKLFRQVLDAPRQRRHKQLKWGLAAVLLVLLAGLLWQWLQIGNQAERTLLITGYENQINDLVKQAEQIYVLPTHPVNESIVSILQEGEQLYQTIAENTVLQTGEKNRLLGLIMLRAEYYDQAITLLEAGQAESLLLAEAWTKLYIEKASDYSDQHGYEQAMQNPTLQQTYLQPALKYIDLAHQQAGQANPLLQAFALSQTDSLSAGLEAVNQILAEKHWNKDAVNLKALILSASMEHARQQGQWSQAREFALKTAETYQLSTQMARSYPPGYQSLCFTHFELMADGIQRSGLDVEKHTLASIEACEQALVTQPENSYPKFLLSRIYLLKARWAIDQGQPAHQALTRAKDWNQQAGLADLFNSSWNQALILATEAQEHMLAGDSAMDLLDQSLGIFERLLTVDSPYRPYVVSDLLFVLGQQAHELVRQGQAVNDVLARAESLFNETMLTPDLLVNEQWGLINNMAQVYLVELRQQFEQQQDITEAGQRLLAFLNPADNQLHNDPHQLTNLANTHLLMAESQRQRQRPLADHLKLATEYLTQARIINPTDHNIMLSQAVLLTLKNHQSGGNFQAANQLFTHSMAINPNNPYNLNSWARSLMVQAESSTEPSATLQQANNITQRLLNTDPGNPAFLNTLDRLKQLADQLGIIL